MLRRVGLANTVSPYPPVAEYDDDDGSGRAREYREPLTDHHRWPDVAGQTWAGYAAANRGRVRSVTLELDWSRFPD